MQFCLHYAGKLKSRDNASGKHEIRQQLHPQLKALFATPSVRNFIGRERMPDELEELSTQIAGKRFWFVVSERLHTLASLSITMLFPGVSPSLLSNGGDIDNRVKTLLDALRAPAEASELPRGDSFDYSSGGMYCLLQNDNLVDRLTVRTFRDLDQSDKHAVRCFIEVETRVTHAEWKNLSYS